MGLDLVELVMELEAEFGVDLSKSQLVDAWTVGALFQCVLNALPEGQAVDGAASFTGTLWERYLTVVERELGVPRLALRPESRFVADLGAN